MIQFDEDLHEYKVDGVVYPSVTTILKAEGFIDTRFFNEAATDRGTRVHRALQAIDSGVPPVLYDASDIRGYVTAWEAFCESREPEFFGIEKALYSDAYRVAGTADRLATIEGKQCVIDIKTGAPQSWHGLQLAAYAVLLGQAPKFYGDPVQIRRYGVYVKNDGAFRVKEYDDYDDFNAVRAIFTVHNLKRKMGLVA